ncbi:MAG: hypothetical protein N2043_11405 [Ignavibacterium sp.]|nr:hypothetical protein [Ignavibacterium sp.]
MRYIKSSILIVVLVTLLLINSGAYVLLYLSSLKIVKETIHYLIESDKLNHQLIIVSFSKKDLESKIIKFEWIEEKEFRFNGKLYDIKKDFSDEDSLRFLCYQDEHENLLEKIFNKYSDSDKNKNSSQPVKLIINFLALFFQEAESQNSIVQSMTFSLFDPFHLIYNYLEVLTPPPKNDFTYS